MTCIAPAAPRGTPATHPGVRLLAPRASSLVAALICTLSILTASKRAFAAFSNYNSILIGDRAAGMGGAFTALTDDPAGGPYYNPASVARMPGSSLSATVNVYNKYDVRYGSGSDFEKAPLRINRGFFRSLPASSGSVIAFGKFAVAMSVVVPDYDFYSGELRSTQTTNSFISSVDESLWAGGSFSARLTAEDSIGLTAYYTARSLIRSINDTVVDGTRAIITNEEKKLTNNSLLYILGYQRTLPDGLSIGLSFRFPSIEISGDGSYYRSQITTDPFSQNTVSAASLRSETRIPMRIAIGIAHEEKRRRVISFDLTYHGREIYRDLDGSTTQGLAGDVAEHKPLLNAALGAETYIREWLRWRLGVFTNFSSHPRIRSDAPSRRGDHVQMWGFSSNLALYTQEKVSITFGGYYTGGRGRSLQQVGGELNLIPKNVQVFTMLLGSAYYF